LLRNGVFFYLLLILAFYSSIHAPNGFPAGSAPA
jgi:hypothetical protein